MSENEFTVSDDEFEKDMAKLRHRNGIIYSLGGIFMFVGGSVWLVIGLLLGRIYFYPPILMLFGIIIIIRGILIYIGKKKEEDFSKLPIG